MKHIIWWTILILLIPIIILVIVPNFIYHVIKGDIGEDYFNCKRKRRIKYNKEYVKKMQSLRSSDSR